MTTEELVAMARKERRLAQGVTTWYSVVAAATDAYDYTPQPVQPIAEPVEPKVAA